MEKSIYAKLQQIPSFENKGAVVFLDFYAAFSKGKSCRIFSPSRETKVNISRSHRTLIFFKCYIVTLRVIIC